MKLIQSKRPRPVLLYALHSGNLYGTEKMALATLEPFRDEFDVVVFAPPGEALLEAERRGIRGVPFRNAREFAIALRPWLARYEDVVFAATGVVHSAIFLAWNLLYRRRAQHVHLVHGGPNERDSYGRKKALNYTGITFVAVSDYARERLIAHGVRSQQVEVVENFLPRERVESAPRRPVFVETGIREVVLVTRVDPSKRVDLLLDALDHQPELRKLNFRVLGGAAHDVLLERARRDHPNVRFEGYCAHVPQALAASDLLLHTCPSESFGLVIVEAMAAGIPVLVPDQGGASALVEQNVSGFRFRANDGASLAAALLHLMHTPAARLNSVVRAADERLATRYSSARGIAQYRQLFLGQPISREFAAPVRAPRSREKSRAADAATDAA